MTSANPGGEPLVIGNDEALARLAGIADALLLHDREIVARCDDSVLRVGATGMPQFIRRARGYTSRPVKLPRPGPSILATGAWLKNTICITRGDEAFLSPHVGDLDNAATCGALVEMAEHLCAVLDVRPQAVAHDLHPDFFSTRFALEFAAGRSLPAHAVQHHHAHVAAVAAEHCIDGPLLGLALDGIGLGSDGAAWGGELLRVDGAGFERLGHLTPLAMPGGDAAAREPWRMAAAALHRIGRAEQIEVRFAARPGAAAVSQMLARKLRCPPTSSMGRWFDAAAALLRVRETSAYEGQAPMLLEALATGGANRASGADSSELVRTLPDGTLDPTPLIARLADEDDAARGAALFHDAIADGLARWVAQAAESTGLRTVALGGGCFLNALLTRLLVSRLEALGIQVLEARQAPPNDGGIALGQAWVAICRMTQGD
jgi:hydrogenase maturation protein HypF